MKKVCKKCERNRLIGKFSKNSRSPDGKDYYCRDCRKDLSKQYYTTLKGRINHRKRDSKWKKNNKDKIREYNKQYYKKKRHIILYNKKCRESTECILITEPPKKINKPKINKDRKEYIIKINPRKRN